MSSFYLWRINHAHLVSVGAVEGVREGRLDVREYRGGQKPCVQPDLGTLFRKILAIAVLLLSQKGVN